MTCPSFSQKGDSKDQCREPKAALDERECSLCKKIGHRAPQCPGKPARPAHRAEEAPERAKETSACVGAEDGFIPIKRRRGQPAVSLSNPPITI